MTQDDVKPESVDLKDPRHPANDKLYAEVPVEELPGGESLHMTAETCHAVNVWLVNGHSEWFNMI